MRELIPPHKRMVELTFEIFIYIQNQKGYLFFRVPSCIIYSESESDVTPICPQ